MIDRPWVYNKDGRGIAFNCNPFLSFTTPPELLLSGGIEF